MNRRNDIPDAEECPIVYLVPAPDMKERDIEAIVRSPLFSSKQAHRLVRVRLPEIDCEYSQESLHEFVVQIKQQIQGKDPILLGFCYGGAIAIEVARELGIARLILVSSLLAADELPLSRRILCRFFLVTPEPLLTALGNLLIFVMKTVLRKDVAIPRLWKKVKQNRFLARHALSLQRPHDQSLLGRIHGERDGIIPNRLLSNAHVIHNAGHFLFVTHRKEMLKLIKQILEGRPS